MKLRSLGSTGLVVSPIGLGLAAIWSIIVNFFRKLFGLKPKS